VTLPQAPTTLTATGQRLWRTAVSRHPLSADSAWRRLVPNPGVDQFAPGGEGAGFTTLTDIYEWRGNFTKVIRNIRLRGFSYENGQLTEDSNSDVSLFRLKHPIRKRRRKHAVMACRHIFSACCRRAKRDTAGSTTGQNGMADILWTSGRPPAADAERWLALRFSSVPLWGILRIRSAPLRN